MRLIDIGDEEFSIGVRGWLSAIILGIFSLFVVLGSPPKQIESDLLHPVWAKIFLLLFLFFVWICICCHVKGNMEGSINSLILKRIPALDTGSPKSGVLRFLFLTPAAIILASTLWKGLRALISGDISCVQDDLYLWISVCPIVGAMEGVEWMQSFTLADMHGTWSAVLSLSFSMFFLFCMSVVFAVITKLMAGELLAISPLYRVLTGIAMVVYTLYLPGWIGAISSFSIHDCIDFPQLISFIDQSGSFMIPLYILLALVTAIACSEMIWSLVSLMGLGILLAILSLVFDGSPTFAALMYWNTVTYLAFFGYILYLLGSQVWGMVPSDD